MPMSMEVIGLGGSLRAASTSRAALQVALDGGAAAGAATRLLWVRDLDLPLYTAEHSIPRSARKSVVVGLLAAPGLLYGLALRLARELPDVWLRVPPDSRGSSWCGRLLAGPSVMPRAG